MGGMDSDGASLSSVEIFDPATNSWRNGPSMAVARDNPGSAVLNGKIYVFGGRTRFAAGGEVTSTPTSVEMFDPATNTWTELPMSDMPTGRRTPVVGVLGGKAIVIGGENAGQVFNANEEFDPSNNSWRTLSERNLTARHGAAGGTIGNDRLCGRREHGARASRRRPSTRPSRSMRRRRPIWLRSCSCR